MQRKRNALECWANCLEEIILQSAINIRVARDWLVPGKARWSTRAMTGAMLTMLTHMALVATAWAAEDYAAKRRSMIEEIEKMAALTADETGHAKLSVRVLKAMAEVPRHEFVPREQADVAYKNRPLPIGHGQVISQPFLVALMTDLLQLEETSRVLEVGTGSGYQAAVLSLLAGEVYTIEILPELGKAAQSVLKRLGYDNVTTKIGDGYQGWKEYAPFDAIIVTAAPDHIPQALIEQLKPNGRMVIPVGGFTQDLMVVTKQPDGRTISRTIVPVRFVPLIRD